jgi:hypothetical protein
MALASQISGIRIPAWLNIWLLRYGLGLGCLALVLIFALLHAIAPHVYLFFTRIPDGMAKLHPFVDLRAILQGGACWRAGVDVYRPSPCLYGGTFNYSPLLLRAALLPIGPGDALAGGLLYCVIYAAALTQLPPATDWNEFWLRAAAAFSPAAYYALEQGNLDALIFASAILALRLPWRLRGWGYAIFALGAAAKFYPVAFFALALRESRRTLQILAAAGLAASLLAVALYGHGLMAAITTIPSGTPFRASFGRIDLPRGVVLLRLLPHGSAQICSCLLALAALALAGWRRNIWSRALDILPAAEARFLIAGATVTAFCFMAAQNIEYRAIFLLLTLPGLVRLGSLGVSFRLLPWIAVALLWEAVPRAIFAGLSQPFLPNPVTFAFWLLREAAWWWLATEFLGLTLAFVTREASRLCYGKLTQPTGTHKKKDMWIET